MNRFKIEVAIERIQNANRMAYKYYGQPITVAYSGGKDSQVVEHLAERALGTDFILKYNHTGIDYPDVVRDIKKFFKECDSKGIKTKIDIPKTSMFKLIEQHMYPPTLIYRFCCHELKEKNEKNTFLCTGVRWAESIKRQKFRDVYEVQQDSMRDAIKLSNDNDAERQMFETCKLKATRCVNPIVDWTDEDVWTYIKMNNIQVSPLYKHFDRIGCIGCPMAPIDQRIKQFKLYPGFKRAYLNCFDRMLKRLYSKKPERKDVVGAWQNAYDVFDWWMNLANLKNKSKSKFSKAVNDKALEDMQKEKDND